MQAIVDAPEARLASSNDTHLMHRARTRGIVRPRIHRRTCTIDAREFDRASQTQRALT